MADQGTGLNGQNILDWLSRLEVAEGRVHDRMVVFPVHSGGRGKRTGDLEYRTLSEAIAEGWVEVTERPSATVPDLVLRNRGRTMVLVFDGEEIVGGKQNRIVNASFLVAAESEVVLPVTCVEQGRWRDVSPSFASGESANFSLRREKSSQVAESLRTTGRPVADQSAVWEHLSALHVDSDTFSETGAMNDLYRSRGGSLSEYERGLPYCDEAIGMIVAINGNIAGAELFDQPRTARVLWTKLVRSYALDALAGPAGAPISRSRAIRLLERARGARFEACPSLALGEDVRLEGEGVTGAALVYQGTPVHVSLFRTHHSGRASAQATGIARASFRRQARMD
ncbi:MAG: hypothetical protein Q7R39_16925 [Dehalococcoidia bacterium]|nr:hypothetical protein [Dehalococcoidia bacterium]